MPFAGSGAKQMQNIEKCKIKRKASQWEKLSDPCRDFLEKLLVPDPGQRLTSEQALKHDWIARRDQSGRYHITPLAQLQADDGKLDSSMLNVDDDTIDALIKFTQASRFRRACMSVMAWTLSQQERAAVRDAFIELDVKRQGTIKLAELKQVLSRFNVSETDDELLARSEMLEKWARNASADDEIEIDYTDFLAAMVTTRIQLHEEHMVATFKTFDSDSSGFITIENLREVLGADFSESELEDLTKAIDPDNVDKISYERFVKYLQLCPADDRHSLVASKILNASVSEDSTPNIRRLVSCSKFKNENSEASKSATRVRSCVIS